MTGSPRPSCLVGARPGAGRWLLWTLRRPLAGGIVGGCRAAQSSWGRGAQGQADNPGCHHEGPQEGIPYQNGNQQVRGGRRERQRLALEALGAQEKKQKRYRDTWAGIRTLQTPGRVTGALKYKTRAEISEGRLTALLFGGGNMASEGLTEELPGVSGRDSLGQEE